MKQIFTLFLICVASLTFAQFNDGLTPKGPKMNQGFSVKGNSVTNIEKKTMTNSQTALPSSYAVNQAIVDSLVTPKANIATLMALIKSGAGTPEGVVTAIVGTLYLRTDGGANTTLYIKESGVSNTGWIAK